MADQQSRGGKKEATGRQPDAQKQQGAGGGHPRPGVGQPGGPKEPGKSDRDKK